MKRERRPLGLSSFVAASRFAAGLVLAGCSVPTSTQPPQSHPTNLPPGIAALGRVAARDGALAEYAWSGSGVRVHFRGTGLVARLKDDNNEHQVVVDGSPIRKITTKAGLDSYVLIDGLRAGEHEAELSRRTEASFGPTVLLGIDVIGGELLAAPAFKRRYLEVVGDSISCGYGNEGEGPTCSFSAATENHYLSYAAVLARALDADLSTVAWSGRGVFKNYNGEPGEKLGTLYDRILPETPTSVHHVERSADAVVVNLGTNDFSTDPDPTEDEFATSYVQLLRKIRQNHPKAFILCTIGPMLGGEDLDKAARAIARAVTARKSEGDMRLESHVLTTRNDNPGCDYHPGIETHRAMAEELKRELDKHLLR
ncbi:MAG: SGNH/GDSL hydrolase family protein [Polyangiaceae bacterium]